MKRLIVVILLSILTIGCFTLGQKVDPATADRIKIGVTTEAQVTQILGKPFMRTKLGNGDVIYTYAWFRSTANVMSFITGATDREKQNTYITFGPDNIVKDFTISEGGSTAKGAPLLDSQIDSKGGTPPALVEKYNLK